MASKSKIDDERAKLEMEKADFYSKVEVYEEMLTKWAETLEIQVSGETIVTTLSVIRNGGEDSRLAQLVTSAAKTGQPVVVDRDPTTFKSLINYLRNERREFPAFTGR